MEHAENMIDDKVLKTAVNASGLGRPATRAVIETLLQRDYVIRNEKLLIPTAEGASVFEIVRDKNIA